MRRAWPALILLATSALLARDHIAAIEFFGDTGLDVEAVRKALPVKPGDLIVPQTTQQIRAAVKSSTGRAATDVATACCDKQGDTFVYVGLAGQSSRAFALNPAPTVKIQVSPELAALSERMDQATDAAVRNGNPAEEQPSPGYRMMKDPQARAATLAVRDYVLQHEDELYSGLESSDGKQRAIAADALGFANRSSRQIAALVHSSRDPDGLVRNNATRALLEMAQAGPVVAGQIPPDTFIDMLWSGIWSDRNKASGLLWILSASRDPQLLSRLKSEAFYPIVDIARWDTDHALAGRMLLGRILGVPEQDLLKLVMQDPMKIPGILPISGASKP